MTRLLICGVAIVIAGVAAYEATAITIRADGQSERSTQRIITMPATEFARLEQGFETFEQMSKADQDQLREIHVLLQDPQTGSRLGMISRNYYQWYKSLGPGSKAKLNEEHDPRKKLALVQSFLKDQDESRKRRESNQDEWMNSRRPRLSPDDLAAVMAVVEDKLREGGQFKKQLDDLESLQGLWRYNKLMKLVRQKLKMRRGLGPQSLKTLRRFFTDERFVEAISDEKTRQRLEEPPKRGERSRRNSRGPVPMIYVGIIGAMIGEYDRIIKADRPTDDELEDYFQNELDHTEQDKLLSQPADRLIGRLEDKFMRAQRKRYPEDPRRLFVPRGAKRGRWQGPDRRRFGKEKNRPSQRPRSGE